MSQVDMVTVLMASALVSVTLAVAFLILGTGVLRSRALTIWGLAHGCWGLGLLFLLTRGVLPDLAAVLIPNGLLVLGQGLAWCGAKVHKGTRAPFPMVFAILAGFLVVFSWYILGDPNISARIVLVRLVIALFALATSVSLWPRPGEDNRSGRTLAALSFLPHTLLMLITAFMGLLYWDPKAPFMAHPVIVISVALGVIAHLCWGLGVLVMVFQRMVEERESANTVFKALVEQTLVGIYELRDGIVTYANPEMRRMFGYEDVDFTGLSTLALLIAPEDRDRVARMFEAREQGLTDMARYSFTGLRRTGERFQVEVQGTVVRRAAGVTVVMGVALDVTDRVAAERALIAAKETLEERVARRTREMEEHSRERVEVDRRLRAFAMAIEQNGHMIVFTDARGRVEYANFRFLDHWNVTAPAILGRDIVALTPGGQAPEIAMAIRDRHPWAGDIPLGPQGRQGWIHATLTPIRDVEGARGYFVIIQTDISDRKKAERDLTQAKDMAEMACRAKSELLANLSHDLRTPLEAIVGFSDGMRDHLFGPLGHECYDAYVRDISGSARQLLALTKDFLDVAAMADGCLTHQCEEDVILSDLVDSALRLVADRVRQAGLILRVDLGAAQDRLIHVDARRIKQVVLNLLSNAVKFTPTGGSVSLTACIRPDGALVLSVSDTGVGMSKEEISIALSRFGPVGGSFPLPREGMGLGLSLAQHLAQVHDAVMDVRSEPGMGTTVSFTLPPDRVLGVDQGTGERGGAKVDPSETEAEGCELDPESRLSM
ncbi:MAG: PAS domain-containing sensor histidine kinase [Rhodospirillum sp.]|nr:PAS domain-containing sensor histidine kinase [Rhodospirillum sp.]MCF8491474.1 PAS domain-containing sensor histidine kinase [Rhodospirillum sp.]